jgi:acetolactate synthase I/III small subunit
MSNPFTGTAKPADMTSLTAFPLTLAPSAGQSLHTLSVLVRNQPGVLVRVSLVFARRGYNIESLVVSPDVSNGDFSRMTITCRGDDLTFEQISKQLTKLIDVVQAIDHTGQAVVETEIALLKLKTVDVQARTEILQIAEHYKAKVVDYGSDSLILRVYGESDKVDSFVGLLRPFGISELIRSGKILMARGPEAT